jgi:HlyD family secretion protein
LASFNIPEILLPQLPVGQLIVASVPALGRSIEWRVKSVAVEADFATQSATSARGDVDIRTFEVKLEPLEGVSLRDGMSVVVELQKPLKK